MGATTYTIANVIDAQLRGQAWQAPAALYVALHTADPGLTGASEVSAAAFPSYVRRDSLQGDSAANAWSAADAEGKSFNQKQLIFPVFDGASDLTITHFAVWDAASGGNCLFSGALTTARTLSASQVFVADKDKLALQVQ